MKIAINQSNSNTQPRSILYSELLFSTQWKSLQDLIICKPVLVGDIVLLLRIPMSERCADRDEKMEI